MSVVDVEIDETEDKPEKGTYICKPCHAHLATSMNIGLPKTGYCSRCQRPTRLYMVH